jgi:hypothetical protein
VVLAGAQENAALWRCQRLRSRPTRLNLEAGLEEDFDVGDAFLALDDKAPRPAGDTPAPAKPRREPLV